MVTLYNNEQQKKKRSDKETTNLFPVRKYIEQCEMTWETAHRKLWFFNLSLHSSDRESICIKGEVQKRTASVPALKQDAHTPRTLGAIHIEISFTMCDTKQSCTTISV